MAHRFSLGDEVVIRSSTLNGRHGVVTELQAASIYRLDVSGVDRLLFFSEQCLVSPGEAQQEQEHLDRREADMAVMTRLEGTVQPDVFLVGTSSKE